MAEAVLDTLRLPQSEIARIISELEPESLVGDESNRRFRRYRMQLQRGVLTLRSGRSSGRHFTMAPRDLSAQGMGLLLGCYVPTGSSCTVLLRASDGGARSLDGTIVRCRHAQGLLHDVGVRFSAPVTPEELLISPGDDLRFRAERVDIATLSGSMVIVDDDPARTGAIGAHFVGSCLGIDTRADTEAGLAGIAAGPQLALVHDPIGESSAAEFIAKVRSAGHTCPIVVFCRNPTQAHRRGLLDAGAHEVIDEASPAALFHLAAAEFVTLQEAPKPAATRSRSRRH